MPQDLAAPERWLESQRRSRHRRLAQARAAARARLGRRGLLSLVLVMALGAGGATAAQSTGGTSAKSSARSAKASKTLKRGMRGPAVVKLQRALGISADGIFGRQTKRAVKRFQRRNGLVVDGVAGPATLGALGLTGSRSTKQRKRGSKRKRPRAATILARIAECESGGDPTAVSPDGRYRGKYQFHRRTWKGLGGKGDPAKAPEAEQDRRAAALYADQGIKPWPHCGRQAIR